MNLTDWNPATLVKKIYPYFPNLGQSSVPNFGGGKRAEKNYTLLMCHSISARGKHEEQHWIMISALSAKNDKETIPTPPPQKKENKRDNLL